MDAQHTSLFIGRFQPFHRGHLDAVEQIFAEGETDLLIIGIGSAEENYTPENPFSAGERFAMIYDSLLAAGIGAERFNICPVRNIHHYGLWPHHNRLLLPPFARVYSGSPLVQLLFGENADIEVRSLRDTTGVTATTVRERLRRGESCADLVPPAVEQLLAHYKAGERIQRVESTQIKA